VTYNICYVYSEKTPDDGQRNCPKHVEVYSKNKFENFVHLVGFIIRICHDARSREPLIRTISYFLVKYLQIHSHFLKKLSF